MLTEQALMMLAAKVAPFVRTQSEIEGRVSPEITQEALRRVGAQVSTRDTLRIDGLISNYFV